MGGLTVASGLQVDEEASVELQEFFRREMQPYLEQGGSRGLVVGRSLRARKACFSSCGRCFRPTCTPRSMIWKISAKRKRELDQQTRYHRILHGWLLVHIPALLRAFAVGGGACRHGVALLRRNHAATRYAQPRSWPSGWTCSTSSRPHPFRSWRLWLSVLVPVIAVVWFVSRRGPTGQKVYSSGPLSGVARGVREALRSLPRDHAGVFRKEVSDTACLTLSRRAGAPSRQGGVHPDLRLLPRGAQRLAAAGAHHGF